GSLQNPHNHRHAGPHGRVTPPTRRCLRRDLFPPPHKYRAQASPQIDRARPLWFATPGAANRTPGRPRRRRQHDRGLRQGRRRPPRHARRL
uniref:Uncharacterized protein n=1 Tax=Aegilops tauschii subsp. strangulata TaxID=200361 RepID=A0A452XQ82_AEGTS